MAYTAPPPLPSQETRPDTFDDDVEAMVAWWPIALAEIDAARNQAVSAASAGATGFPYLFDTGTTAADPGAEKLRFNNSTISSATAMYISATANGGAPVGAMLDTFDDSTSAQKGILRVVKSTDPSKFAIFKLTALSAPNSAYRAITLTYIAGPGGFSASDPLALQYAQIGDKGETGLPGTMNTIYVRDELGGGPQVAGQWNVRNLNAVKVNGITGASVASNRVTLPAGTYEYDGSAGAFACDDNQTRIYNTTTGTVIDLGSSAYAYRQYAGSSMSLLRGTFTLSAQASIELQHYVSNPNGGSFSYGLPEIRFRKIA